MCRMWDAGEHCKALRAWEDSAVGGHGPAWLQLAAAAATGAGGVQENEAAAAICCQKAASTGWYLA